MDVAVLGGLRVTEDGADRTPRGQRSRDMLAVLLLRRGQSVEATVLFDQVWGDDGGWSPTVVHTQMSRLRRDIGGDHVRRSEAGYHLVGVTADVDRFAELLSRARGWPAGAGIALLREALGLWRSDRPYADVSEELVAAEVARLATLRTGAREQLAERLLEQGDREAVEEASALSELLILQDPLRERGHELAILAAARAGRRAEALERYDALRTTLRDELGIDPGPEAQELHLQVLREELPLVAAAAPRASKRLAPAPTGPIHGRDEDLVQLQALLAQRRLVSIVGLGGVGKSRLLFELATVLGADRVDGYVDLASLPERPREELVEAVGQALGVTVQAEDPVGSLATQLGDRDLMLLADEAERCVTEMAELAEVLLARCAGLRLVVTSRRPLGVAGEVVHVLGPLATPPARADTAVAADSPAVLLLRERIADRAPGLVQGEESLLRLAEFTRRVDGLPLALQLLAAQAPGRTLDELAALIEEPLSLGSDDAGLAPRHRTMQDTIGWSVDRLSQDEQRTLRRLSVFAGRFEGPAARAVVGTDVNTDAALHALVRDALVHVERTEVGLSFRLLRPVRDLAHEQLVGAGELDAARGRHRRWHADRWRGAQRSDALLLDVREHYPDYVAALAGAHEAGRHEQVVDLTATLGLLWNFADMLGPGLRWSARALESELLTQLERAQMLRMRALLQLHYDPAQARRELTEAIPVLAEHQDMVGLSGAHYALSLERSHSGYDEEALEHARLGVEAARHAHEERLADALANLAVVASLVDPDEAESAAQEAWALVTRSGSTAAVTGVVSNLAWAQLALDRADVSLDLIGRAKARVRPHEVPAGLRFVHGWVLLVIGDPSAAVAEFNHVIAANEDALDGRWLATVYVGAACGLAALQHPSAPELLSGAEANWARMGTVATPWQEPLLAAARERAAEIGPPPWGAENAPGPTLAALVQAAARTTAGSGSGVNPQRDPSS